MQQIDDGEPRWIIQDLAAEFGTKRYDRSVVDRIRGVIYDSDFL